MKHLVNCKSGRNQVRQKMGAKCGGGVVWEICSLGLRKRKLAWKG